MIDVSQWRASIGLWSHCQAASSSSRPAANSHQCHTFKGIVDSKSYSITSIEKAAKLPVAAPIIALLLLFISFPLHMMKLNAIFPTGMLVSRSYARLGIYHCECMPH